MDDSALRLADLTKRHGFHLKKGLGQNFLADPVHLGRIVAAAELQPTDTVLEIGPGAGTLTRRLAEQDAALMPVLQETLAGLDNVRVVQGDILALDPAQVALGEAAGGDYKVVANLPYYITSAAIRRLLTASQPASLIVLTIQREVAQRIVARPPDMSLLAVSVQFYAHPELVARIPAGAFYPPPKVDSAILRLRVWPEPPVQVPSDEAFFAVVRAGFHQRRKQLRNSLRAGLGLGQEEVDRWLHAAGIAPDRRAETLTLEDWGRLARGQ